MEMLLPYLAAINSERVILASASPRRQELLGRMGVRFEVVVSDFAEDLDKKLFLGNPANYPLATARAKGEDVLRKMISASSPSLKLPHLIISADTIVLPDEGTAADILEKADQPSDCYRMLSLLQGKRHKVITGVVLLFPNASKDAEAGHAKAASIREFTEETYVYFDPLDDAAMKMYAAEHPDAWRGKAGAYGIQDLAATFIPRIEGDYYNVMGFPVCAISKALRSAVVEGTIREN